MIALLAAIRRPDLVGKLVLLEPPVMTLFIDIPPKPSQIIKLLLTRPGLALSIIKFATRTVAPAQKHYRRGEDELGLAVFARGIFGIEAFEAISDERMQQARENLKADKAQVTGAGFPRLEASEVSGIGVPVLLLHGDGSPLLFKRLVRELERLIPDAARREVPAASHLLHEDNPAFVNQAILDFLGA